MFIDNDIFNNVISHKDAENVFNCYNLLQLDQDNYEYVNGHFEE